MRVVVALGGNALLRRGEPAEVELQQRNVRAAIAAIAPIAREHELVITHGNGPQIGLLALQAAAYRGVRPYPLDVLGAETEGMIGYLLELALANALPEREVATLLTQVEVDAGDPAFAAPAKPIGPVYPDDEAARIRAFLRWPLVPDGAGWRRAVASPEPQRIREIATVARLLAAGVIVACAGGGGIPVVRSGEGLRGVEAVVDKDLSSALLAEGIRADALLLLTDVAGVHPNWPDEGELLGEQRVSALRRLSLAPGSMAPKVEAACRFVERTGGYAAIGAMEDAEALLARRRGTRVIAG